MKRKHDKVFSVVPFQWKICDNVPSTVPLPLGETDAVPLSGAILVELEKTWRSIPSGKIRCEGHRLVPFQRRKCDSMPYRLPYLLKSGWELFHLQHRRTFHTLALPPLFKRFFNPAHPFKCFSWFSRSPLCQRDPLSFSLRSFCHFSGRSCCAGSLRHRWCGHVIHNKWPGFYFPLNLRDSHSIYIWTVISQSLTHTHTHTHTL